MSATVSRRPGLTVRCVLLTLVPAMCLAVFGCIGSYDNETGPGAAPYSIEGTITKGGAPLAGVTVHFDGPGAPDAVVTDAQGKYRQIHFPPGTYTVRPDDGVHDFYYGGELANPTFVLDENESSVAFEAVPAGSRVDLLSPNGGGDPEFRDAPLTITWRAKGEPGTQVLLQYRETEGSPWQDIGTFDLVPAPPAGATDWQEYSVQWTPTSLMPAASIRIESTSYAVLNDQSDGVFAITQGASVAGTITYNSDPLDGILVQFFDGTDLKYTTNTDATGSYLLGGMLPGTYRIQPADESYSFTPGAKGDTVILAGGAAEAGYDFAAAPVGASLVLTYPNGNEVVYEGNTVTVVAATSNLDGRPVDFHADVDGDGTYETTIATGVIVAGTSVTADWVVPSGSVPPELTTVRVRAQQMDASLSDASDGVFTISKQFSLSGKVTTDGVTPVENARVVFSGPNMPDPVLTQVDGMWTQSGFRYSKSYNVEITPPAAGIAHTVGGTDDGVALTDFGLLARDLDSDNDLAEPGEADYYDRTAGSRIAVPLSYTSPVLMAGISGVAFLAAPAAHSITVVHPKGSPVSTETDVWLNGYDSKTIEWAAAGANAGANVDIGFSPDAGLTWNATLLFDDTPNDGTELWLVGTDASVTFAAKLRVVDTTYRLIRGESADPFVLAPSGGISVETRQADGSAFADVMVGIETAGFASYKEPQIDPFRPFLTSGDPATDNGLFPLGTFRLAPSRLGYEFSPEQALLGVLDGTVSENTFTALPSAWTATATEAKPNSLDLGGPFPRRDHTAVWTGSQMVVWGGSYGSTRLNTGGIWTPGAGGGTWEATSMSGAPSARMWHSAVWTGSQMVVWGGYDGDSLGTGGIWTPGSGGGTWEATSATGAPVARDSHIAVWTGSQMVVWGGYGGGHLNTGGIWTPGLGGGTWEATSAVGAPSARYIHTAVWTGSQMVVWGGYDGAGLSTGGIWTPGAGGGTWEASSTTGAPSGRYRQTAVWTGSEMIVWGGYDGGYLNTGGVWTPDGGGGTWEATSATGAPTARYLHIAIWTGSQMVVWGGWNDGAYFDTGGIWTPGAGGGTWEATSTANVPSERLDHTVIWTGSQIVVWGGLSLSIAMDTGGIWTPGGGGGTWEATSTTTAPSGRDSHTAVWTGSQMVIWGGWASGPPPNDGGIWTPGPGGGTWEATSTTGAPSGRKWYTAVWTGSEMVVWGGYDGGYHDTGGVWTPGPGGGTWVATSTTNAPSGRDSHAAVWTGSQMIVWGGRDAIGPLDTGGIWTPDGGGGTWEATSTAGAPSGRRTHAAVWTGSEMLVWGGDDGTDYVDTGGIWTPGGGGGTWEATSTSGTPSARRYHTAIWTGSQMVVWGGDEGSPGFAVNTGAIWTPGPPGGTWEATSTTGAPAARETHTAVWTGSQMVVWGGVSAFNTGGVWTPGPGGGTWEATSTADAPSARYRHTAVWTGLQMVVWGGSDFTGETETGGIWTPRAGGCPSLRKTSAAVLPSVAVPLSDARVLTTSIDGGTRTARVYCGPNATVDVHNHPVATDTVTSEVYPDYWLVPDVAQSDQPQGAFGAAAAYLYSLPAGETGACVWGGQAATGELLDTGSFFGEASLTWSAMQAAGAPSPRTDHAGVSLGDRLFVWGGLDASATLLDDGGIYERAGDSWAPVTSTGAPSTRVGHGAAFDPVGGLVYVFGGTAANGVVTNTGGIYDSVSGFDWTPLTTTGAPSARTDAFVFWTSAGGGKLVVWGGGTERDILTLNDGGMFDGASWTAIPAHDAATNPNAPVPAFGREAVINPQNGHLLVLGGMTTEKAAGLVYDHYLYDFDPATGTWAAPVPFADPTQPVMDFKLIHTGLGTRNNIIMMGGHIMGEPVQGGFIR